MINGHTQQLNQSDRLLLYFLVDESSYKCIEMN